MRAAKQPTFARLKIHLTGGNMKDRAYESASSEDEVCCIIGQAVIELSDEHQPVNKSTLSLKLLAMADRDRDDERILLYWIARKAINQPHQLNIGVQGWR
jgi:hypothetical protein